MVETMIDQISGTMSGVMSATFQRVEPVSKKTKVVASLKEAILSGAMQSGEPIVEAKIAQQFGVGQGLIREALIELEHQGFVTRTPFSGTQVVKLSADDAQQIFEIRCVLEPLAVALAGPLLTPPQIQELTRLGDKASRAAAARNLNAFFESHLAFRRKIWELSGNKYLQQAIERAVIPLYALYLIRRSEKRDGIYTTVTDCIENQDQILAAFKARDFAAAEQIACSFLERTKEYLKTALA
jgi:DNA-binding GntR family transcriptional regulator